MKGFKAWTTAEIRYLYDNDKNISMNQAIKFLGRTKNSIRNKVNQLGIKLLDEWEVTEYYYYVGDNYITSGTIYEISDFTGIKNKTLKTYTQKSIQNRLKRILIKLEDEVNE